MGKKAKRCSSRSSFFSRLCPSASGSRQGQSQATHERRRDVKDADQSRTLRGSRSQSSLVSSISRRRRAKSPGVSRLRNDTAVTTTMLTPTQRKGSFRDRSEKRSARCTKSNGGRAVARGRCTSQTRDKVQAKSVASATVNRRGSGSDESSVVCAPSLSPAASAACEEGSSYHCACHCHKRDIARKSWAAVCTIQELLDELSNKEANSHSCMDWQPSTTTYILRGKLAAGTEALPPTSSP